MKYDFKLKLFILIHLSNIKKINNLFHVICVVVG